MYGWVYWDGESEINLIILRQRVQLDIIVEIAFNLLIYVYMIFYYCIVFYCIMRPYRPISRVVIGREVDYRS